MVKDKKKEKRKFCINCKRLVEVKVKIKKVYVKPYHSTYDKELVLKKKYWIQCKKCKKCVYNKPLF